MKCYTTTGESIKIIKLYIIITTTFIPVLIMAKASFTDRQVAGMVPKYFARDHYSPELTRTRIYGENGKKVFHLEIKVNRNRFQGEMDYTVGAMASICQYAKRPFDKFVIIMHTDNRNASTEMVEAKAGCTINHFVHKKIDYKRWLRTCAIIEEI